jgi:hypothetical protein
MGEYLSRLSVGELIALVSVCGGLFLGLTAIVGGIWCDVRKKEIAAALKHDMLERGMSADEIRTVLDAGTWRSSKVARGWRASSCA